MATTVATIAVVNMTLGDNESLLYSFQLGATSDVSWSLAHKDLYADFKGDAADLVALIQTSTVNSRIVIHDEALRVFSWHVPQAVIEDNLPVGSYVYDLLMVDQTTGDKQRLMTGKLKIVEGPTKEP